MNGLQGKCALVTGAASAAGIGFASAHRMAVEGARVVLTDIDGNGVMARVKELRDAGCVALGMQHDVTREDAWEAALAAVRNAFGRLDILVNNAGIAVLSGIDKFTLADWHRQVDVNMTSTFLGCRTAIAQMRKQGSGGAIVNISSVSALVGMPGTTAYSASKGGIRMMSRALAIECAAEGIRVNSVHPGVIETDIQKIARRDNPGVSDIVKAMIPLGHTGQPEDIGAMVAFLASDDARYVTAGEFVVDGGLTAR